MPDLLSIKDLTKKDIDFYLASSEKMEKLLKSGKPIKLLQGKLIASMFFEASTRTNMSFQAAAKRLGAKMLTFHPNSSSSAKGETFEDTVKMMDGYADALIIRHPEEGSVARAAKLAEHPVINAGDGDNQHPSQTLIDLYTIKKLKKKIAGLNVTLLGDLKHARAMRSLLWGLSMYGAKVTLVSPQELRMEKDELAEVKRKFGATPVETEKINLKGVDILYVCRIQKERFAIPEQAAKLQNEFRLDASMVKSAPKSLCILHPLPKIDEIPPEIDSDPRAKYFEQAKNGVPVRMAVLHKCIIG